MMGARIKKQKSILRIMVDNQDALRVLNIALPEFSTTGSFIANGNYKLCVGDLLFGTWSA